MVHSIIKKIAFLSFFLLSIFAFPRQVFADTFTVGDCGEGCYTTIQLAVNASADDDTIHFNATPVSYDESVIVDKALTFDTDVDVNVTSFDLRNSASLSGSGTFNVNTVYVKTSDSYPPGGGIGDAIALVKAGGTVEVENKSTDQTCSDNSWSGGITINKNLTLQSASLVVGEEVCLTDNDGTAITVTSGDVTLKNFILFDSVNGMKVDGGTVTVTGGAIANNTHGVVTASGTEVNATGIRWGHASGPYNALYNPQGQANDIGNEVLFCPFYTDTEGTNLDDSLCRRSNNPSTPGLPSPPICSDQQPGNAPQLFQINRKKDKATLYFTPSRSPVSYYYISYGLKEGDERFGTWFSYGTSGGAVSYTINHLSSRTTYYFKVRAGNGCMTGAWSNWLRARPARINYLFK